ncbi:MAG: acyl--CoA ligase [Rhodococcus sp.]|nr:acyl--CoA ligase [Rhodococcus sp. (in: high G+C Gram-positive bacteria)]
MANEQHTLPKTLTEAFQARVAELPDAIALRTTGEEMPLTWSEYGRRVQSIAAGLADLGVRTGDRVAIMLADRPEFDLFDNALLHLGAAPVSVSTTFSQEQIRHLLADSAATVVVTEGQFVQRLREAGLESVNYVVTIEGSADAADPEDRVFLSLEELEANPAPDFDFDAAWRAVTPENVATVIYAADDTGILEAVEVTHASALATRSSTSPLVGADLD